MRWLVFAVAVAVVLGAPPAANNARPAANNAREKGQLTSTVLGVVRDALDNLGDVMGYGSNITNSTSGNSPSMWNTWKTLGNVMGYGSDNTTTTNSTANTTEFVPFPFEKLFVLNLNRSHDRWEQVQQRLGNAGWPYSRFDAVDGASLYGDDVDQGSEIASEHIHSPQQLTPSERGNFLSYQKLFQHIVESNISNALIMEDDVEFEEDNPHSIGDLKRYVDQLNSYDPDWDIVWLTWYPVRDLEKISMVFPEFQNLFDEYTSEVAMQDTEIGLPNVVKTGPSVGLWSFAVSNAGAKKLMKFFSVQDAETDMQIARLNLAYNRSFVDPCTHEKTELPIVKMYGFRPQLFHAHSAMDLLSIWGGSTIGAKRFLIHQRENRACNTTLLMHN